MKNLSRFEKFKPKMKFEPQHTHARLACVVLTSSLQLVVTFSWAVVASILQLQEPVQRDKFIWGHVSVFLCVKNKK